jgi:hypothetical protein
VRLHTAARAKPSDLEDRRAYNAEYLPVLGTYLIVDSTAQNNQFGIMPSSERGRFKRANVHL